MSVTIPKGEEQATYSVAVNENKTTFTCNSLIYNVENPTRLGYTFAGWTDVANGTTAKDVLSVTFGRDGAANSNTLYAVWEIKKHTLTFTGIGTAVDVVKSDVEYGTALNAETLASWSGYTVDMA